MEVGGNQHGFCCWTPDYSEGFWLNMGNCRPPDQVRALHSCENQLSTASVCRNLHSSDSTLAWGTKNHCIRYRLSIHCSILGALAQAVWDQPCAKLCLAPSDLQTDWASESNLRRHAESLCYILQGFREKWLPLVKFSYNNSYQKSIKMAPFEALYGQKCRTPVNWIEPRERRYYGIDFVTKVEEQVRIIQQHMRAA